MGDGSGGAARFERDGSTLRFGRAGAPTAVSVCSPRIIRVDLEVEGQAPGPSHLEPRTWTAPRFDAIDGEPLRLSTADLTVEVATDPVRLAFLDASGALAAPRAGRRAECRRSAGGTARRRVRRVLRILGRAALLRPGPGRPPVRPARRQPPALELAHRPRPGLGRRASRCSSPTAAGRSSSTTPATRG